MLKEYTDHDELDLNGEGDDHGERHHLRQRAVVVHALRHAPYALAGVLRDKHVT